MRSDDKKKCIDRYNKRLKKFGRDSRTLGWSGGGARQHIRFKALMEIQFFLKNDIKSVLDVGCGFGDMGVYINDNHPQIKYCGIDINSSLIEMGKQNASYLDLRELDVLDADVGKVDIVVESGIFNYKYTSKRDDQLNYISKMLSRFQEISNFGFSADFMSTYVDYQATDNFHLFPNEGVDMLKKICNNVVLRHDYLRYEFCLYGIKNEE